MAKTEGLPDLGDTGYRSYIGPMIEDALRATYPGITAAKVTSAAATFRAYNLATGWRATEIYPAMPAALAALQAAGYVLHVASAKPQDVVDKQLPYFDLTQYFTSWYGSIPSDPQRAGKVKVLAYALAVNALSPADCVMIGDRQDDIHGGQANATHTVGVTWGFGPRGELRQAGAETIIDQPEELLDAVAQVTAE